MYIQQSALVQPASNTSSALSASRNAEVYPAAKSDRPEVSFSAEGRSLAASGAVYSMETGAGRRDIDLDSFFKPGGQLSNGLLDTSSLLLPNPENVKALQDHISLRFPDFLVKHNIPEAPEKIEFDNQGQLVLPADYAYADQLREALAGDDEMRSMLSTVNGLSSHVAALQALQPMHDALDSASSQAEIDAILERFSHLLNDNARYPQISLMFSPEGELQVAADARPLV